MTKKTAKKSTKSVQTLPAQAVRRRDAESIRGGTPDTSKVGPRDPASGLPTGKRM